MLIRTALAIAPHADDFTAPVTYLVESVTERDGVTIVMPGTRWTDRAEAQRAAAAKANELIAQLRRDMGSEASAEEVAALRIDRNAFAVSWVVGAPGDETLVWRKSWRVVEDTTPRTVRAARPMTVHQILLAAVSMLGLDSITVRGEITEGSWLAADMDALDAILNPCGIVIDGAHCREEYADESETVIHGSWRWHVSPGLDSYEAPVALHLGDDGRVTRVYSDGSESNA